MSEFPEARAIQLPARPGPDGSLEAPIELSLHEAGAGPAVVLLHGFPELGYSWRKQLPVLAGAGFRALAPDQRGYGGSSRPEAVDTYDIHHLTGDVVALLDALSIERAVFVGHDWGGFVAWAMPLLHPDRTAGVVGVNTPYLPRTPMSPLSLLEALACGKSERMYMLWFQEPEVADAVLARDVRLVFEKLFRSGVSPAEMMKRAAELGGDMNPFRQLDRIEPFGDPVLTSDELEHYVSVFSRTGFTGGINWYRNLERNWQTTEALTGARIEVPSLMVIAEWDPALRPELAGAMPALVPDLETHTLEGCGHWTPQERPEELNRLLIDWLGRRFGSE